eukprot:TRINITY_DN1679_c0_g1_i1.p1 TRINITY_DN1679_c0_g1~~TRINITY_DN1679_c0_g1_i1.p1  ORF type:complete len:411 (-),score=89.17 TRINITY_DN1679_c0_g1_i1:145-1377(-)
MLQSMVHSVERNRSIIHEASRLLQTLQFATNVGPRHADLKPVTEKKSHNDASPDLGLFWGVGEMQGWRPSMEDDYVATASFGSDAAWAGTGLFGVFDGHGGSDVAKFCAQHLPKAVAKGNISNPQAAMKNSFLQLDSKLAEAAKTMDIMNPAHPDHVGCTAVACLVRPHDLIVANAGDSRVVLGRRGRALDLSEDHKPGSSKELARIKAAGGVVVEQQVGPEVIHRVNGVLSLSRSIGDHRFKKDEMRSQADQIITCLPDVKTFRRQRDDDFLVVACDGIWDVLSSQEVVDRVQRNLPAMRAGELQPSDVVGQILDECLAADPIKSLGKGTDNMTMLIVVFQSAADGEEHRGLTSMLPTCVSTAGRAGQPSATRLGVRGPPKVAAYCGIPALMRSREFNASKPTCVMKSP